MAFGGRRMAFGGQRSAVVGGRRSALNNQNNIKNAFVKVDTLLYKVFVFICYQFIYYTLFVRNVNSILESLTKSSWLRKLKTHTRGTDGAKSLFVTKNLRLTYTPTCTPPFLLWLSHTLHISQDINRAKMVATIIALFFLLSAALPTQSTSTCTTGCQKWGGHRLMNLRQGTCKTCTLCDTVNEPVHHN